MQNWEDQTLVVFVKDVDLGSKRTLELANAALTTYPALAAWFTATFHLDWDDIQPHMFAFFVRARRPDCWQEVKRTAGNAESPRDDLAAALCSRVCLTFLKAQSFRGRHFLVRLVSRSQARQLCQSQLGRLVRRLAASARRRIMGGAGGPPAPQPSFLGRPGKCVCSSQCTTAACPCFRAGAYCTESCKARCRNTDLFFSSIYALSLFRCRTIELGKEEEPSF